MKTLLTGASVVLAASVLAEASVLIEDGVIAAIEPAGARGARRVDLSGRLLLPGLVDLHCDALEKELEPRPNARFPLDFAVAQADLRFAAAGITTPFHAIAFASGELGVRDAATAAALARAVRAHAPQALVDNRVHCRYEISDAGAAPLLLRLLDEGAVSLFSLMDHTPGQGQFKHARDYKDFLAGAYQKSGAQADALLARKRGALAAARARVVELAAAALKNGVPVASHDDDAPERISAMAALGARISEFPVNARTAAAARACGMRTVFGAPNILRGGSQASSMRALDAVRAGLADCLCADYAPASMLAAVFAIVEHGGLDLPAAARLVSLNPARAAGLENRGEIAAGKRADLLVVDVSRRPLRPCQVWAGGRPVLTAGSAR
jgi:alpha-D-ribose 1-methylphosphonate 5-triphosphate diphosphatase